MANVNSLTVGNTTLPIANTLAALDDVSAPSPIDGQALVYDATAAVWRNKSVPSGGGGSGVIEGEYTIPEIYWCDNKGKKLASGNTIAGQNAKAWYQRTGKYIRAVIVFGSYSSYIYGFNSFGFNSADLFGDGKMFPENSEPVFFKLLGFNGLKAAVSFGNNMPVEPIFSLHNTDSGTGKVDFYIKNDNSIQDFPNTSVGGKNVILMEAVCL